MLVVSPEAYAAFVKRLDEPPRPNQRLRRPMQTPAPWDWAFVVHAISDAAKALYRALGFQASPADPMTLMVTLADVRALIAP